MRIFILLLFSSFSITLFSQNQISFRLYESCEKQPNEEKEVIVKFKSSLDYKAFKSNFKLNNTAVKERVAPVINAAIELNDLNISQLKNQLQLVRSNEVSVRPLWIANAACLSLLPTEIAAIAELDYISFIDLNKTSLLEIVHPIKESESSKQPGAHEPGHDIINAPAMWALGYTGQGTKLLTYDTGFWPAHPAISNRYLGNYFPQDQCWFPYDLPSPGDKSSSHGTHVTGTVLGLDPATSDTIGVAPNAYFIATDPIVTDIADVRTFEELALGFEWALNPDDDLSTTYDIPDVINNSWGRPVDVDVEPCNQIMIDVFALIEAAGIANVFSAGNSGPDPMTISVPHNINEGLVNSFTVGALNMDANLSIASFSSRGPSFCPAATGSLLIKPEVSAPGVSVRSAVGQNEYDNYSGTSMAAPHVSGAVLLLKEAFPYLSGEDILLGLYHSTVDLGETGEDNVYGNGVIDVFAAYNFLIDQGNTPIAPQNSSYELVINEILMPNESVQCGGVFNPEIILSNQGDSTINEVIINYAFINTNEEAEFLYSEPILPGESVNISLGTINSDVEGNYELLIKSTITGGINELDTINNRAIFRGNVRPEGEVPFFEDFEDGISSADWNVFNDDLLTTWDTISTNGLQWSAHSAWMNFYDYSPRMNQKDELQSRTFNLNTLETELFLEFDYAYQKRGNVSVLKDTLRIFAREDCDSNWDLIWEAHSDSLTTMNDNSTLPFFPDSANHWKSRVFDLSNYIGSSEFQFKIHTSNRNGNNFFIDNVRLFYGSDPLSISENERLDVQILENPSNQLFTLISQENWNALNIIFTDISGRKIHPRTSNVGNRLEVNLNGFADGVYLMLVSNGSRTSTVKLIKAKH